MTYGLLGVRPHRSPGENLDDEWRAESDGAGDLLVFCPECWQQEFGDMVNDRPA